MCPVDGVVGDSDDCVEHENPPFYDWTSVFPGLQVLIKCLTGYFIKFQFIIFSCVYRFLKIIMKF